MHDTKIRLNAEIASAEARSRIDTLRLHGRILRLRREKEELKSNTAKLSIENEELLDRLIKVELECCNALHQLKREKERSKLAIETMMERGQLFFLCTCHLNRRVPLLTPSEVDQCEH